MADKAAGVKSLDFTNVKEGGQFKKTRQPEGDYKGRVTKVAEVPKKKEPNQTQWLFTIEVGTGKYPYYCGFTTDELWKIRNLFVAAGIGVPKKKLKVDPGKVVGRTIAVTLEDDEYDGKMQSNISAVFPIAELDTDDDDDDDAAEGNDEESDDAEDEAEDEDEEDEEPEPAPAPKRKKKPAPKPEPEEEDDDDEDLEELDIEDI